MLMSKMEESGRCSFACPVKSCSVPMYAPDLLIGFPSSVLGQPSHRLCKIFHNSLRGDVVELS